MSKPKIPILSFLGDVITGKAKAGQVLNKVLPFRKSREAVGEIIKGGKDLIPLAQVKDASVVRDAEKAKQLLADLPNDYAQLNNMFKESPDLVTKKLYEIKDLLDDGRLNDSAEGLSAETKFKIRIGTSIAISAAVVYQILAYFFGWPSIPLFNFIGTI